MDRDCCGGGRRSFEEMDGLGQLFTHTNLAGTGPSLHLDKTGAFQGLRSFVVRNPYREGDGKPDSRG